MKRALKLAARGRGRTSPNPMVGAVLARAGEVIGEGYHRRAGEAHAEINALGDIDARGATLYVTPEPCSTHGRTPPCTEAILQRGIRRVVVAARDPNPKHAGAGLRLLRRRGVEVVQGLLAAEAERLNEVFNHWIVRRLPFVHLKCAMSLDGKIATNSGQSKWITGAKARAYSMRLRHGVDAIVVGVNTVIRDDPALTPRASPAWKILGRIILDPNGRTPTSARVISDEHAAWTTIVVGPAASSRKVAALEKTVRVLRAPMLPSQESLDLHWVLAALEKEGVTSVLVEGGGETHFSFLAQGLVNRVHFLYAPLIITGRSAPKAVGGIATLHNGTGMKLHSTEWKMIGTDMLLSAYLA